MTFATRSLYHFGSFRLFTCTITHSTLACCMVGAHKNVALFTQRSCLICQDFDSPRTGVLILRLLLHSTLRQSPFVHHVSGTSSLPNHLEQMLYPSIFKYIPCRMLYLCQMNLKQLYLKTFKNHKYFIPKREGTTLTK